jgi:hypothetical protein
MTGCSRMMLCAKRSTVLLLIVSSPAAVSSLGLDNVSLLS